MSRLSIVATAARMIWTFARFAQNEIRAAHFICSPTLQIINKMSNKLVPEGVAKFMYCSLQAPTLLSRMRKFSACTTTEKCTKFVSGTQKRQANYSLNNNKLSSVPSCWGVIIKCGWEPVSESLKQTAIYTLSISP